MNATAIANTPDSTVYGPVYSWRFGNSLGVDLLFDNSICSFRCPYCQLGKINMLTTERQLYVTTDRVIADLKKADWRDADVITFSGNGEPTLALNLGEAIKAVKKLTGKKIVVLSNGSLLSDPSVRKELMAADHVSCKLDAPTDDLMLVLNRPASELNVAKLMEGLATFREEFKGKFSVQTMLLPANSKKSADFIPLLKRIHPDEVHLNLPSRPFPEYWRPELRGEHKSFSSDRAFRLVPLEEVQLFKSQIEKATKLNVRIPPAE